MCVDTIFLSVENEKKHAHCFAFFPTKFAESRSVNPRIVNKNVQTAKLFRLIEKYIVHVFTQHSENVVVRRLST
jgi:hypothetical protein